MACQFPLHVRQEFFTKMLVEGQTHPGGIEQLGVITRSLMHNFLIVRMVQWLKHLVQYPKRRIGAVVRSHLGVFDFMTIVAISTLFINGGSSFICD